MTTKDTIIFDGRKVDLEWFESTMYPTDINISQVVGFCMNNDKKILIVKNDRGWAFPGGHPKKGESTEETLIREVREEANVSLDSYKLIGYMDISDPGNDSVEGKHYIQLRYFAKIGNINNFEKEFETSERKFVYVEQLPKYIKWASSPTGKVQLNCIKININK